MLTTTDGARTSRGDSGKPGLYRIDVQGLRGVAVLLVVLYHAGAWVPGGYIGVDMFFVISGFVIALGLHEELDRTGSLNLLNFYRRRIRRLLPSLAVVTSLTVAIAFFVSPFTERASVNRIAIGASTFRANWLLNSGGGNYFDSADELNPLLHTWSLSVEEQFYFVLPLLMLMGWVTARRVTGSPERLVSPLLVLVAAGSLAYLLRLTEVSGSGSSVRLAFYSSIARAWEFLAGVVLAIVTKRSGRLSSNARGLWGLGVLLVAVPSFLLNAESSFPGLVTIPVVIGTVLLLWPAAEHAGHQFLRASWLTWIGDRSYGWYLWHWPAIVFARLTWPGNELAPVTAAVLSLGLASLSFITIERPMKSPHLFAGRQTLGLAIACIAVPCLGAFGFRIADEMALGPGEFDKRAIAIEGGCQTDEGNNTWDADSCTWDAEFESTVFLVGDSHAASISSAVRDAARVNERSTTIWTRSGCPFTSLPRSDRATCGEWQQEALSTILGTKPEVVVINNRGTVAVMPPAGETRAPLVSLDGTVPDSEQAALETWEAGLRGVLGPLQEADIEVLLVLTGAEFDLNPAETMSILRPDGIDTRLSLDQVERRRGALVEVERGLAREFENVTILDPVEYLCEGFCQQRNSAGWLYFDDDHVSVLGAQQIPFADVLEDLLSSS